MNTTDEIMAMVEECCISLGCDHNKTFAELRTAIEQLVEQAKWAHHTPALMSDANAAADLAEMTLIERLLAQANKEANELADLLTEAAQALSQKAHQPLSASEIAVGDPLEPTVSRHWRNYARNDI